MPSPFRAAVVQAASIPRSSIASASKAADLIRQAAAGGAKLIVFPEAFIGDYPKGSSFGTPVGMRHPEGREDYRRYHEGAMDLNGPEMDLLNEAVKETGTFVVIGVIERDGGTVYCTALFLDGEKGLIAKHRKLMPTGAERLIWGFGDGSTMPVIDTPLGKIGAVICWENYMPLMRMAMYDQGITLYCTPTADDRDSWPSSMQHIALEGRCFVLSACQYITRGAWPDDFDCALGNEADTVLLRGGSMIVSPLGQVLTGPHFHQEDIFYADIDPNEVVRGKYDFDVAGHYSRPDIFNLRVNVQERKAVTREVGA